MTLATASSVRGMTRTLFFCAGVLALVGCNGRRSGSSTMTDASTLADTSMLTDASTTTDASTSDATSVGDMSEPPAARTCQEPELFSLAVGESVRLTGTIPDGIGNTDSVCGLAEAVEQVYLLHTATAGRLVGTVSGATSLYVRAACDGTEFTCHAESTTSELTATVLPAGDWYFFVDGRSAGDYDVSLRLDPLLDGENCTAVEDLGTLTVDEAIEVRGDTSEYGGDSVGSCATFYRVYEVQVPTAGQLGAIISALDDFSVLITGGASCAAASELACLPDSAGVDVDAGTYWIWVGRGVGSYILSIGVSV